MRPFTWWDLTSWCRYAESFIADDAQFHFAQWIIDKDPVFLHPEQPVPPPSTNPPHWFYFWIVSWILLISCEVAATLYLYTNGMLSFLCFYHLKTTSEQDECMWGALEHHSSLQWVFIGHYGVNNEAVRRPDNHSQISGTHAWLYQPFYTSSLLYSIRWPEMDGHWFSFIFV